MQTTSKVALYALGAPGAGICRRLAAGMASAEVFLPQRHARPENGERPFRSLHAVLVDNFSRYQGHVLVCAAGMVVRCLVPLLRGKAQDPAVVVVDQKGQYAVSLLSGHLGGANELAQRTALILGGEAVITTATDNLGLPSLEMEARRLGMGVENLSALAGVSGALVDGRKVPVCDPEGWLDPVTNEHGELFTPVDTDQANTLLEQPVVWVGWRKLRPPRSWLVLRPRCLVLGMGCNRNTGVDELMGLASDALDRAGAARGSLKSLASAEAKRHEPGLLELAQRLDVEPVFFTHEQLAEVEVPNPSKTVLRCLGTSSVCEAAALLASQNGKLILPKIKSANATAAVALI
ncbi:MAG: cobalamin biosynthesis protein [Deltaproteobacteria bacterium]|nr:cobalamin biosynthesis protein [Deltaproteobacteria bacterium]